MKIAHELLDTFSKKLDEEAQRPERHRNFSSEKFGELPLLEICKNELEAEFTPDIEEMIRSVEQNPITVCKSANSVGKTHGAAHVAVAFFLANENSQVYTMAAPPESNLKNLLWGEIGAIAGKHPQHFQDMKKVSTASMEIRRKDRWKSFITGVTIPQTSSKDLLKARFSGKHAPYFLAIVDEGDAVPEAVYEALEGCMSGGIVARLLVMFNPRGKYGVPYHMEDQKLAKVITISAFTHPNVVEGKNIFPGAVSQNTTIKRIHEWTRPMRDGDSLDESCFQIPVFLEGKRGISGSGALLPPLKPGFRKVTDPSFSYMVLARYPTMLLNQLIDLQWVEQAKLRWKLWQESHGDVPPEHVFPIGGFDVAEEGDDKCVYTLRYGGYVAPQIVWGKMNIEESLKKVMGLHSKNKVNFTNVDATGVGAAIPPIMNSHGYDANRIMVSALAEDYVKPPEEGGLLPEYDLTDISNLVKFRTVRDQMLWGLREWLRLDPSAMLPPDEELDRELTSVLYSKDTVGNIVVSNSADLKATLRRSPDKLMSLALTFARPKETKKNVFFGSFNYLSGGGNRGKYVVTV